MNKKLCNIFVNVVAVKRKALHDVHATAVRKEKKKFLKFCLVHSPLC